MAIELAPIRQQYPTLKGHSLGLDSPQQNNLYIYQYMEVRSIAFNHHTTDKLQKRMFK